MSKRLLFGSLMILVLAVLFVGDAALSAGDNPVWSVNLRGIGFYDTGGIVSYWAARSNWTGWREIGARPAHWA